MPFRYPSATFSNEPVSLPEAQQDAVAVERALALAAALEVVGQQLEQPLRHGQLAVGAGAIVRAQQRLAEVEVRERGLVGHAGQARVAHHALPLQARRRVRARGLQLDRRQRRVPRLGQHARRLAVAPLARRAQRPLERPLLDGKQPLRLGEAAQPQQHVPRLAVAPQHLIRRQRALEPALVEPGLEHRDLGQQRRVQPQRLARAPGAQRPVGAILGVDLVARRH